MKRALALVLATVSSAAIAQRVDQTDTGIIVTPLHGPIVHIQVYGDDIFRVIKSPTDATPSPSLMVTAKPVANAYTMGDERTSPIVTLNTAHASAEVDLRSGAVSFRNQRGGKIVLSESGPASFAPTSAGGQPFVAITQQFNRGTDEGFYGLGQHQNGQMNYNGEDVDLAQHNMDVAIPFVVSTRNDGLLW